MDARERRPIALHLVHVREFLERRGVVRIGRENRLEEVGRPGKFATGDRRVDGRADHGGGAIRRLFLHPQPAQEDARRLGVRVELEGLLGRPHRLGPLPHLELRLGEERETRGRAGRGFEDGHGGVRVVLGEEGPDQVLLRIDVVGGELEGLLENLRGLVVRPPLQEHRADQAVLHHGLVLLIRGAVEVREADLNAHVGRVDCRHLLVDGDRVGHPVVLLVVVGQHLVLAACVLDESLLVVQVGELVVDLELRGVDLVDLLEDRDRLQEEAVPRVEVGDPGEKRDRIGRTVHPDVEVPHLVEGRDVLGVVLEDAQVLLQRLVELAFGEQLFGGLEDLFAVDRHF